MVNSRLFEQCQVVGEGRTQLLCETFLNVKPPMSKIIGESYDVQIADYTVFNDRVLVKGIVEKTFYYKHPHIGKSEEDSQKEATDKSNVQIVNKQNSKEEKKKDCESTEKQKKTNKFKCLDGWCKHIESYNGIVHFYQQKLEFAGTVEIPGIMPGDSCQVDLAEVKDYDAFVATETENNGLINAGRQMFVIDIALIATRSEKKSSTVKKEDITKIILVDNFEEKPIKCE